MDFRLSLGVELLEVLNPGNPEWIILLQDDLHSVVRSKLQHAQERRTNENKCQAENDHLEVNNMSDHPVDAIINRALALLDLLDLKCGLIGNASPVVLATLDLGCECLLGVPEVRHECGVVGGDFFVDSVGAPAVHDVLFVEKVDEWHYDDGVEVEGQDAEDAEPAEGLDGDQAAEGQAQVDEDGDADHGRELLVRLTDREGQTVERKLLQFGDVEGSLPVAVEDEVEHGSKGAVENDSEHVDGREVPDSDGKVDDHGDEQSKENVDKDGKTQEDAPDVENNKQAEKHDRHRDGI